MKKNSIFTLVILSLLIATAFAGCVEKEEVKEEEIKPTELWIKPEEIIKGIELASIEKIDETDSFAICDLEFMGEKDAKIKGTLLIPSKPNGAGIISLAGWGAERDISSASHFARVGYVALACDNRGHGESGGYMGTKYMELDAIKQVTILENLLENLNKLNKNLPGRGRIGMYGHSVGAGNAMHVAAVDPRIKALALSGTILNAREVFATISPHFWINYRKMAPSSIMALAVETHILPLKFPETLFASFGTLRFVIEESFMHPTAKVAKSINIPTLCIYGENDPTARPEPYKRCFEQINTTEKELRVIPNVNNVFVTPEGKSKASEVLEACVEWMNKSLLEGENE